MAVICTPFSEEPVYQNWFLSFSPPKFFTFLALNRKYSHLENSSVALLHFYSVLKAKKWGILWAPV